MAPRRESRRPFGRPAEAPGPVETFESSFQIPSAAPPQLDTSHQVLRLSQNGELLSSSGSQRRQRRRSERGQVGGGRDAGAGSSQHGGRLPSVGAHDAASTAPASASESRTRQANDVLPEPGPSKRRRPSQGASAGAPGHRQTHSTPTVSVSAAHPSGSTFQRSNSSTVLPSEMLPDGGGPLAGPRSWPRTLAFPPTGPHGQPNVLSPVSPSSPLAYRGGNRQTPRSTSGSSGRGEFSPHGPPSSNSDDLPFTGALRLTSPHTLYPRVGQYDAPDLSPVQGATWQYPTSAPQTPGSGSLRAPSLPPNSASPSPNLGMVGDFDFDLPPGLGSPYAHPRTVSGVRAGYDHHHHVQDTSDLPPLPPDQFSVDVMLTQNPVYAHAPGTAAAASRHPQAAFYGQQYPHGSISGTPPPPHPLMSRHGLPGVVAAPDLSEHMCWPSSIFGEEHLVAYSSGTQTGVAHVTQGFTTMSSPHTAPGSSGPGYYALPAPPSHPYAAHAGPSYSPTPAGPAYSQAPVGSSYSPPHAMLPYSSQGEPALYASQAASSAYASQGGSSYPFPSPASSQAGPSYSSQRRSSAH
ncbi:hypothetical protein GSI_13147 [Ganoderma sinense ZZ0214-1]|uniref:Uncharacterized protein n=1 Tax=Ganoderma sinense ZZ0214-1 TaxID=1077348 RepID=A0A2G8RV99_9APHY|nr:hypothetical protein GSI_13147 [Ganoderma sinense ZZ0214-1]